MWLDNWHALVRVAVVAVIAFVALIALIRFFGKRTISKMNPGDFVITVAVGSIAANLIVLTDVPLERGLVALTVLLGMQFASEWATSHLAWLRRLLDGVPVLLVHRGQFLTGNLRRENIDQEDILAALRQRGIGRVADAEAVILELDGTFSVISTPTTFDDVGRDVTR